MFDENIQKVDSIVKKYFQVYDTKILPQSLDFHVVITDELDDKFENLRLELKKDNYVPIIREEKDEYVIHIIKHPKRKFRSFYLNLLLLIITIISTIFVGAMHYAGYFDNSDTYSLENLAGGFLYFSIPILAILGSHEMGHYLMARKHKVAASLPFFIPAPTLFGTMGAFISIREPIPNKKALIEIGAAGPIVGFLVAIVVSFIGNFLSSAQPIAETISTSETIVVIHLPLIYDFINMFTPLVSLHPTAFAAWVGFLVTAINLLPAGQLDGGHIAKALLGKNAKYLSYITIGALFVMGLFYAGWLLFAILIVILGIHHPPPLNNISKLDIKGKMIGVAAIFMIILCIIPTPIEVITFDKDFDIERGDNIVLINGFRNESNVSFIVNNTGEIQIDISFYIYTEDFNITFSKNNDTLDENEKNEYNMTIEINNSTKGNTTILLYVVSGSLNKSIDFDIRVLNISSNYSFATSKLTVNQGEDFNVDLTTTQPENVEIYSLNGSKNYSINNIYLTENNNKYHIILNNDIELLMNINQYGNMTFIAENDYFECAILEVFVNETA